MTRIHYPRKYTLGTQQEEMRGPLPLETKSDYPRFVYILFYIFTLYLTLPLVDVLLLGLSLFAPVFAAHTMGDWDHNSLREIDLPFEAGWIMRKEIVNEVWLLDEDFLCTARVQIGRAG